MRRSIRKLSYVMLMCSVVCLCRLAVYGYCEYFYSADSSFAGCVFDQSPGGLSPTFNLFQRLPKAGPGGIPSTRLPPGVPVPVLLVSSQNLVGGILEYPVYQAVEETDDGYAGHPALPLDKGSGDTLVPVVEGLRSTKRECIKKILFWASAEGERSYVAKFSSRVAFCRDVSCKVKLTISKRWSDFQDSHAVIFHHKVDKDWKELVRRRPRGQIWIFYTRESPAHFSERNNFPRKAIGRNVHNWTKVYLSGSEFPTIYGRFLRHSDDGGVVGGAPRGGNGIINWAENKTKLCSWVASNCKVTSWNRLGFVNALRSHMPIDRYGKCGDLNCSEDCTDMLSRYKFYLALESNTCREYITEKVWRNSFEQGAVPVVYGAPRADYEKLLPPNSFIHAEDFESFGELAGYLLRVDGDDDVYNSYFAWRREGSIIRETGSSIFTSASLCGIARKLVAVDGGFEVVPTSNRNIKEWWEGSCFTVKKPMVYS